MMDQIWTYLDRAGLEKAERDTGICASSLSRFRNGKNGLLADQVAKLIVAAGLEIVPQGNCRSLLRGHMAIMGAAARELGMSFRRMG